MKKDTPWKVAVVGCGSFATGQYLPNISKTANAVLTAVCDIRTDVAEAACKRFGAKEWYGSVEELVEKGDFDIAIDAASIPAHDHINKTILSAGKHLFSQKPAALTVEDLTEQIEIAKKNHVKFGCVPIHMITPDMLMAKQIIRDGGIGRVLSVKCVSTHGGPEYFQYRSADPSWFYEPGAGALFDMGVHALDKVTGVMGPAKSVYCLPATARKQRTCRSGAFDGKVIRTDYMPDTYYISLDFGDDRIGFVDTGFTQIATRCPPLEIYGEQGVISFKEHGGTWPNPEVYIDSPAIGMRGWITPQTWTKSTRRPNFTQCCPLADLVEAIENDTDPVLSPEHARHVLEIMCAIPLSIEKKAPIDLHTTFKPFI